MAKLNGKILPFDPFLTQDKNGLYHWYSKDPMKSDNREEHEISIENVIMELVGRGDITNPIIVHLSCARVKRSEPFNISQAAEVRRGEVTRHFEDLTGAVVDILEVRNSSADYPLSGVVFDRKGDIVTNRRYSTQGVCEDGEPDHAIVAVNGPAVFETDLKPESGDPAPDEVAE